MRSLSPEAKPSEATLSGDPSKKNEEIKRFTSEATHIDDRAGVPVTSAEPESEAVNARKDLDDAKSMLTNEGVPETNPIRPRRSLAENFKITFCRDSVKVHFVGAWYVPCCQLEIASASSHVMMLFKGHCVIYWLSAEQVITPHIRWNEACLLFPACASTRRASSQIHA